MTDQRAERALADAVGRWHRAGLIFNPLEYAAAVCPSDRYSSLKQLLNPADYPRLPQDERLFTAVWLLVAGNQQWPSHLVRLVVLPYLERQLHQGAAVVKAARLFQKPPLGLKLDPIHVRTLAIRSCRPPPVALRAHAKAILSLWAEAKGSKFACGSLAALGPRQLRVLVDALPLWETPWIAAWLLRSHPTNLQRPVRAEWFVKRLEDAAGVVELGSLFPNQARQRLGHIFGSLLTDSVNSERRLHRSVAFSLLKKYARLCAAMGQSCRRESRDWYCRAADLVEKPLTSDPAHLPLLRCAWAEDMGSSFGGRPSGSIFIPQLYRLWCGANFPHAKNCVKLLNAAESQLGIHPFDHVASDLRQMLMRENPLRAASCLLHTLPIMPAPAEGQYRRLLLGQISTSLVNRAVPATDHLSSLAKWVRSPSYLDQIVGRLSKTLSPLLQPPRAFRDEAVWPLLWEVLLSPRQRWPSLRPRLLRIYSTLQLIPAPKDCLHEAAGLLTFMLKD